MRLRIRRFACTCAARVLICSVLCPVVTRVRGCVTPQRAEARRCSSCPAEECIVGCGHQLSSWRCSRSQHSSSPLSSGSSEECIVGCGHQLSSWRCSRSQHSSSPISSGSSLSSFRCARLCLAPPLFRFARLFPILFSLTCSAPLACALLISSTHCALVCNSSSSPSSSSCPSASLSVPSHACRPLQHLQGPRHPYVLHVCVWRHG